jgi:DHA1 family tetracycline resistance protein-like MFS transporter
MADITEPAKRSRAYGLIGAAYSGGFVAGPVIGGFLGELGPRVPFWAAAALGLVSFLYGLLVVPESLKPELRMPFSWKRANPFGSLRLLRSHPELSGLGLVYFLIYVAHNVFAAVFVLYAGHRFGLSIWEVGLSLALWGVLDVIVQALLVGPLVKQIGDRATMIFGLVFGAIGLIVLGLAAGTVGFLVGIFVSALWGFAMPTVQSLMTQRVSESEQGQLQGANQSVASLASAGAPIFFGWIYALSVGAAPAIPHEGAAFIIAGLVLGLSAVVGLRARRGAGPPHMAVPEV